MGQGADRLPSGPPPNGSPGNSQRRPGRDCKIPGFGTGLTGRGLHNPKGQSHENIVGNCTNHRKLARHRPRDCDEACRGRRQLARVSLAMAWVGIHKLPEGINRPRYAERCAKAWL
jgi:hypothetical protein